MKIAQIQMPVLPDKLEAFRLAQQMVQEGVPEDTDLIALPEMFCCPYQVENFPIYAEPQGGPLWRRCAQLARERGCYLSAGSVPEVDPDGNVYNTAYVFDRQGKQIAKHRKMHLFDIQVEGGQHFQESATLKAGDQVTTFETEFGTLGLCICYDFRFPELGRLMALRGAKLVLVPAAFNMTTGPAHWEVMFRSQALNNQFFAVGTAPARDESAPYLSWGHSIVTDPWGRILRQLEETPGVQLTQLDLDSVRSVREQLPLLQHRRRDVYELRERSSREEQ